MDIAVDAFFSALFYVVCGAFMGALVGWSLTYLWCHPEPESVAPPRIIESDEEYIKRVLAWKELQVSSEQAQRDTW